MVSFPLCRGCFLWLPLTGLLLLTTALCSAQARLKADTLQADTTRQSFDARLIGNLKQMSERKTIMGKLLKATLNFNPRNEEAYSLDAERIEDEYQRHNYKIVRNLDIVTLNALGYSIHDSTRVPRNFLEKAGNSLHVKTGRGLIRNKLIFRKNEPLEPLALIESERLLRQTEHLLDARIIVNEKTTTKDSVDVLVITRDIFSLGGSGSYSPSSGSGRISLRELNFLGQGHQVRGSYRFNLNQPRPWEASGQYRIENIGKSYISAELTYINQNFYKEQSAFLRRDFFARNTKYAGAVGLSWIDERLLLPPTPEDTAQHFGNLSFARRDAWLGRAFTLKSYNLGYEPRGQLIVGMRLVSTNYTKVPTSNFQDNLLVLGSLGYSVRKYYKDHYLFGFGRIEDVPAGALVSFTAGYENGRLSNRSYLGVSSSFGKFDTRFGYLYSRAAYGAFINDSNWEQGVLDIETLYFTKLAEWGNWKLRHFFWGRGTLGINRHPEELLSINNENGLRGFRSDLLRGNQRVTVNYEANLYTPLSVLGFRLAAVAFADVAWLTTNNQRGLFKQKPFRGYGIGFRFRNEYLSFSTIQILLGYYPQLPLNEDFQNLRVFESSRPYYDFTDFRFTRPGVADFR